MENNALTKLTKQIDLILETIPGIVGFAPIFDYAENNNKTTCSIVDHKNNNNLEISIGIIINRNVASKNLSNDIYKAINFSFKNKKNLYSLKKLNIYIKGVV
ncbi:MAG: hypothetical protein HDR43_02155 [Mycoplasma sp.]|nr:hypothetical protein [Mycoplasma sp.]